MQVEIAGEAHLLQPGRVFTMGRTGDLIIDETPYLHRDFLTLHHSEGFWWLTNVGSRDSVLLTDPGNVSRSELGPGGTLPLLIPHTVVRFAAGPYSYELNLTLESAPVEIVVAPRVTEVSGAGMSGASFTESQLLAMLAVAEPLLKRVGTGVWAVPTAAQAARRLGWTQTRFNRLFGLERGVRCVDRRRSGAF
ncbi:hypothetical protein GCM10022275_13140 [Tessaracoccus defluvii]